MILMKKMVRNLIGAFCLLAGPVNAVWATDYSGTLDFGKTTVTINYQGMDWLAGVDINRIDLGNTLSGSAIDISLTTHNTYNPLLSMLGIVFATDPNETLYNNPGVLADLVTPNANVEAVLKANVTGLHAYAFGSNYIQSNGTTDISSLYSPPLNFVAGTHYYAFLAGGSLIVNGNLVDSSMGYTLSVAAIPEPESYALMLAGLGLVGAVARKRIKTVI